MKQKEDALLLETRKKIYSLIEQFPGIHFRALYRLYNRGTGNLEYHLRYLEKKNLIKVEKSRGNKRLFPLGLNDYERNLLGVLQQGAYRRIVLKLLTDKGVNHKELVKELGKFPSTITTYLNVLEKQNVIVSRKKGREKTYELKDKDEVVKILIAYKESFLDKLVDKFVDTWEE
ncbi:MAG: transcriptional regulator [Nanoarchaeota archaeon]